VRAPATIALLGVLVASAVARFIAGLDFDGPWIAPDEFAYGVIGRSFWTTGHLSALDGLGPFYGLYPVVAGLPLALFGTADGLVALKAVEAIAVTATALITFVWAKPVAGRWWAVAAAALTAALPGLAYSGLIMNEALSIPTAVLAVWLLARTLVRPSPVNQALLAGAIVLATAIRPQAAVLLPTVVVAAVLHAWFSRDRAVLRRLAPSLVVIGIIGATALAVVGIHGSTSSLPYPYGGVGLHTYPPGPALRWIARHAGDMFLVVVGSPLLATFLLAIGAARGRERDPRVNALVATTLAYAVLGVVEVGTFASQAFGVLNERALISIAPPMFVALAAWVHAGLPRPEPWASIAAVLVSLPALLLPVNTVVTTFAVPSAFMTVPLLSLLERTSADTLELVWVLGAAAVVVLTLLIPRRAAPLLVIALLLCLAATSALVQTRIDRRAATDRHDFFGSASPEWIDRAADGPVVYLNDGDPLWNASWHLAFWNDRLRSIGTLAYSGVLPGGVDVTVRPDGRVVHADGSPLDERLVATRRWVSLDGRPLARAEQDSPEPGMTLWRTPSAPRITTWTQGLSGRGELEQPATVTVYDCTSGRLELTLVAQQGLPTVSLTAGELRPRTVPLPPNSTLQGWIPAPRGGASPHVCVFGISADGLVELRQAIFRPGATAPVDEASRRQERGATVFVPQKTVLLGPRENIAYCVSGSFTFRPAGRYADATPAFFVLGTGLTCDQPPEGYVQNGFATPDLGVPAHTYPLYAPP
jgi:hypothetical protein